MSSPKKKYQPQFPAIDESEQEGSDLDYEENISHLPPIKKPYNKACKIYVDLLPHTYTKQQLEQLLSPFGEIESCQIEQDHSDGANVSFGCVIFQKEETVSCVIEKVKQTKEGKEFYLGLTPRLRRGNGVRKRTNRRSKNRKSGNLEFRGLPPGFTESQLRELVCPYGHAGVVEMEQNRYDTIGIAHMGNGDIAESVKNALHGSIPQGCLEPLHISFALPLKNQQKITDELDLHKIRLPGGIQFYNYYKH